jgi:hypothetical protein
MLSRNLPLFLAVCSLLFVATVVGIVRNPPPTPLAREQTADNIPSIGRVQVLNGCGAVGAADKMTSFLRGKKFDVANTDNAASWNYPFTLVISHSRDMAIARQIANALKTGHCVLIRKEDRTYDATVIIGPDYGERIR